MTLLETVLGVAIITIVVFSIYRGYIVLLDVFLNTRLTVTATDLANKHLEFIRNIPFGEVGIVGGIPHGIIAATTTVTRENMAFDIGTAIRNIDDPFDGTIGGNPNDPSPADYKLIELSIICTSCPSPVHIFHFTGRVAPKGLETESTNGALFVRAIDASGNPVAGANVHVVNSMVNPAVDITDTTDMDGYLRIVDVPPAIISYQITVSKSGYSTDRTYTANGQNPNPKKPHATVALQTVTQASFAIDRTSTLNVSSVEEACVPVPNVAFTLTGSKLIGTSPDVVKFSGNYTTDEGGIRSVSSLEWDTYTSVFSEATHDLGGTIPLVPLSIAPNSTQGLKVVLKPKSANALLVTVTDAATGLPLSGASVTLSAAEFNQIFVTGRGFLRQTDWSGGPGQDQFLDESRYFGDDGNISVAAPAGEIRLMEVASSTYVSSGILTSSTFDTGSPSTFYNLNFLPASQPPDTGIDPVRFQLATATTSNPTNWAYLGPDGTVGTFYTAGNTNVAGIHSGDRFFRYKLYLGTASTTFTPNVSDVAITFASACVPPGQVLFQGLTNGTYALTVDHTGYQTDVGSVTTGIPWQERAVQLSP